MDAESGLNAPGNATQTFANLIIRNETVFLIPEIFTEINGDPIPPNKRVALFDGDMISFQHKRPSHIMYREHRRGTHPKWRYHMSRDRRAKKSAERLVRENEEAAGRQV